ncbi:MAG: hypothetical protein RL757_2594 [Bacteroidota bacterium]|jgi:TrmH family RNA methyltransferase
MLSKAKIQFIRALQLKKFRSQYQRFVVEGDKMVRECLENESNGKNTAIEAIFATQDWFDRHKVFLKNLNTDWENRAELVSEKELGQISGLQTPNCAVAVVQMPPPQYPTDLEGFALFLDNIQDPGNVGTILRTADWFGISTVFLSPTCADVWSPKVVQATMGAFLRVNTHEITFQELQKQFPNIPKIGTILGGGNIFNAELPKHGIIVMGNESKGIGDEITEKLDFKFEIAGNGNAESLNVSVATGIICALLTNQK